MDHQVAHQASRLIDCPADEAFAFLADPVKLGRWSLGCFDTVPTGDGTHRGRSLYDGSMTHVRIEALSALGLIRYWVGQPDDLQPRILASVVSHGEGCIVVLLATRTPEMSDQRWARLVRAHEAELDLIQAQLESIRSSGE